MDSKHYQQSHKLAKIYRLCLKPCGWLCFYPLIPYDGKPETSSPYDSTLPGFISIFQLFIKKAHIKESPGLMNYFSFTKTDLYLGINMFTGAYCLYLFCVCDAILLSLCCVISGFSE